MHSDITWKSACQIFSLCYFSLVNLVCKLLLLHPCFSRINFQRFWVFGATMSYQCYVLLPQAHPHFLDVRANHNQQHEVRRQEINQAFLKLSMTQNTMIHYRIVKTTTKKTAYQLFWLWVWGRFNLNRFYSTKSQTSRCQHWDSQWGTCLPLCPTCLSKQARY